MILYVVYLVVKCVAERVPSDFLRLGVDGDDCPGSDLSHHGVSLEECAQICLDDARCTGFTYSTDPTAADLCWPKFRLCVNPVYRVDTSTYILKKVKFCLRTLEHCISSQGCVFLYILVGTVMFPRLDRDPIWEICCLLRK